MNDQDSRQALFKKILARLLRPIAKIMIAYNVTLNAAMDALKRALYDAATTDNDKITDSRISLLTGLHRKDVRRLRENPTEPGKRSLINAGSLVVGIWLANPQFQDKKNRPARLPRQGNDTVLGFNDLIRVSKVDIPVSTLLEAMIEEKVVEYNDTTDKLTLITGAFLATSDDNLKLNAFEKNLSAHLDAASWNLLKNESDAARFERGLHVNKLSASSAIALEDEAKKLTQNVLEVLNAKALALQEQNSDDTNNTHRFSIGAYIMSDDKKSNKPEEK